MFFHKHKKNQNIEEHNEDRPFAEFAPERTTQNVETDNDHPGVCGELDDGKIEQHPLKINEKYEDSELCLEHPPQLPVVIVPGLLAAHYGPLDYQTAIPKYLAKQGCKVVVVRAPGTASIEVRAERLKKKIEEVIAAMESSAGSRYQTQQFMRLKKVHLVGHSLGGLDSRYYISCLGGHERVFSLTTIATPHRGSEVAVWASGPDGPVTKLKVNEIGHMLGMDTGAFLQLVPKYLADFNARVPDHPKVCYQSYSGIVDASTIPKTNPLRAFADRMSEFGPNDGCVSEESAKWGEYRGSIAVCHTSFFTSNKKGDMRILFRDIAVTLAKREREYLPLTIHPLRSLYTLHMKHEEKKGHAPSHPVLLTPQEFYQREAEKEAPKKFLSPNTSTKYVPVAQPQPLLTPDALPDYQTPDAGHERRTWKFMRHFHANKMGMERQNNFQPRMSGSY